MFNLYVNTTAFAGYTIPHPSECTVKLRLQTHQGIPADEILEESLKNLLSSCDVVKKKFIKANQDFDSSMNTEQSDTESE